ncbi:MAG: hypothetical protein ACPHDJ_07345 [Candidatus Puniceispirillaceae bacterium]
MAQSDAERLAKNRARSKRWREKHPDKQKTRCRAWRQENPLGVISSRAKKKGWEFDLTDEWYWQIVNAGFCQKTGLPFVMDATRKSPFQPSVDRVDSSRGYTQDNCQVVCLIFNFAKNKFSEEDVYQFAKAFVKNYDDADYHNSYSSRRSMVLHPHRQEARESVWPASSIRHSREDQSCEREN